jgi:hypothetical protein
MQYIPELPETKDARARDRKTNYSSISEVLIRMAYLVTCRQTGSPNYIKRASMGSIITESPEFPL